MSTEIILKAFIALLPVIVLIIVLHRLDSHRLLGTRFIVRMFGVGGGVAVLCSFVNAYASDWLGTELTSYSRYAGPLIEESIKAGVLVYLFRTHRIGFLIDAGILGFTVGAGYTINKFTLEATFEYLLGSDREIDEADVMPGIGMPGTHGYNIIAPSIAFTYKF